MMDFRTRLSTSSSWAVKTILIRRSDNIRCGFCLLFTLGLGAGPAGKQMSGFSNERLDSGGPHLLHRLHGWHLRIPPDPPHLPRPHTLPQPQEGGLCHRSASYFRKGQVGQKFCNTTSFYVEFSKVYLKRLIFLGFW